MEAAKLQVESGEVQAIYDELVDLYGPMMELGDLALVLRRNRNSIRSAVSKAERSEGKPASWALRLSQCKTRVGKKIMFRTRVVADLLEAGGF
jgi:Zn-dependent M32 family carboxypeptidase